VTLFHKWMMGLKFTNSVVIGQVSWSETLQCNPRSDGVLWIISSEYGLKHLMMMLSTPQEWICMKLHEVAMHEA
jgi:hypothetical protein